jgi:hypothetical protein
MKLLRGICQLAEQLLAAAELHGALCAVLSASEA